MIVYTLKMKLLSDTTFGRGDGVTGSVDREVEHDPYGFPYLRGRTLKGLLSEECDNCLCILENRREHWQRVARRLFGKPGSTLETMASMKVGDARLPSDLRKAVAYQLKEDNNLTRFDILQSLTTTRRQTAIDPVTGAPARNSLRSERVIIRHLELGAELSFETPPDEDSLTLLSIGTLALRRVGSGRNRGRGRVSCSLHHPQGQKITEDYLNRFFGTGEGENS